MRNIVELRIIVECPPPWPAQRFACSFVRSGMFASASAIVSLCKYKVLDDPGWGGRVGAESLRV
jgi:hypothetical protein